MLAEKAIALVGQFLRRAVANGNDLEAREGMALAATLGGLAFSNVGVAAGACDGVSRRRRGALFARLRQRPAAALRDAFQSAARVQGVRRIAQLLGEDISGLTEQQAAERAVAVVDKLRADIGIPGRLRETRRQAGTTSRLRRASTRYPTCDARQSTRCECGRCGRIYQAAW